MNLHARSTLLTILLLGAGLGIAKAGRAQDTEPTISRVELMLVQADGQLKAFSLSTGRGAYVETQGVSAANSGTGIEVGIATGVIASADPVASIQTDGGFDLYTSDVGTTLQP